MLLEEYKIDKLQNRNDGWSDEEIIGDMIRSCSDLDYNMDSQEKANQKLICLRQSYARREATRFSYRLRIKQAKEDAKKGRFTLSLMDYDAYMREYFKEERRIKEATAKSAILACLD